MKIVLGTLFLFLFPLYSLAYNKYSKDANLPSQKDALPPEKNLKTLEKPFRMHKINLLWEKAQKKLDEKKLKPLFADLKDQDKEEIKFKKEKAYGGDDDGKKEAELVKKLNRIILKYKLGPLHSDGVMTNDVDETGATFDSDPHDLGKMPEKAVFKDKKLNKLWIKAQKSGLSNAQLRALKEEFQHHQDKIDQYYYFLDQMSTQEKKDDMEQNRVNVLLDEEENDEKHKKISEHLIREKHKELTEGFTHLSQQVLKESGIHFEEPEVEQLWKLALKSNFTSAELESLKEELGHFEKRLKKLSILKQEYENSTRDDKKKEHIEFHEKRLQDYQRKVNKFHRDFETRIYEKHLEL